MSTNEITCELVDESDLDTRYLAGRLSPDDAAAFEAHFFGCDRCWGLVQQGVAIRSAFHESATPQRLPAGRVTSSGPAPRRWWGLAAAAGIAAVAAGVWQLSLRETSSPEEVFRGADTEFAMTTAADETTITAAWPRLTEADVYRIRLYQADGMLALERETSDTSLSVPLDSVASLPGTGEMFWQVQALDRLRNSIARSDPTRAVLPEP